MYHMSAQGVDERMINYIIIIMVLSLPQKPYGLLGPDGERMG